MKDDHRIPRFLCDEMLRGLAEWLRVAGYDTRVPVSGTPDVRVMEQARTEQRWLLTRDRRLCQAATSQGPVLLLKSQGLKANQEELSRRLALDWLYRPFTRCKKCNTPLQPHAGGELPLPDGRPEATHSCPCCCQLFWEGSHVRRMRGRLEQLNELRSGVHQGGREG